MNKQEIETYLFNINQDSHQKLFYHWVNSPLGPMLAIANETKLLLLEFLERKSLKREIERLKASIKPEITPPIAQITEELKAYFAKKLKVFQTPIEFTGTPFQENVWKALQEIPYGETLSYSELATKIKNPKAFRAVAQANGRNQLALIVPCHRVINQDKSLGGYGGGVSNKEWLLRLESKIA